MKQVLLLLSIVLLFFTTNTNAQLKPAQSQYLVEKGVLINPSFEQGYQGWIITGCTKSLVSETPYLNKSLKLTCTNETFSIKQVSTALTSFSKQQGAFDLQIKTTASGVNVSSITNGVRDNAYSVINSTEFKRFKEIGFIVGGTDNGIEVYSDVNFTGEIIVDNFKLGLGNLTQDIGAAHFVGSLLYGQPLCEWQNAGTGAFPVNSNCIETNIEGNVSLPDTRIPAIKIPNVRTDGTYTVTFEGLMFSQLTSGSCIYALSDTNIYNNEQATAYLDSAAKSRGSISGDFKFSSSGDKEIQLVLKANSANLNCFIYGRSDLPAKFTVHFFPDSKKTIVSQDTELTANTANEFTVTVNPAADSITSDTYGILDSFVCNSGVVTFNYASLGLTVPPAVDYEDSLYSQEFTNGVAITTTQAQFTFTNTSGGLGNCGTTSKGFFTLYKQGADVNKSQTIVGSFEQIRSDDLALVEGAGNGSTPLVVNTTNIDFTETNDNNGSWDGSIFTAQSAGNFNFQGQVRFTGNVGANLFFYKSTGGGAFVGGEIITDNSASVIQIGFNGSISLNAGDRVAIRSNTAATLNNSSILHHITITQQATKADIVANLMQGQSTNCQTKVLSADVAVAGYIADWQFNNLVIGKKYSVEGQIVVIESNTSQNYKELILLPEMTGTSFNRLYSATQNAGLYRQTEALVYSFTATDSTLQHNLSAPSNAKIVTGGVNSSYIKLCQLPDSVISTTEFN